MSKVRVSCGMLINDISVMNIFGETGCGCTAHLFERDELFMTIYGYCLDDDGTLYRHHSDATEGVELFIKGCPIATYIQFGPFPNETVCAADFGFEAYDAPVLKRHVAPKDHNIQPMADIVK